jgi:exodeoxyribonuclease V beta subunit
LIRNDEIRVGSEPESVPLEDEPDLEAEEVLAGAPDGVPTPMADLPAGAAFGSLVHAVLEHADPDAPDLGAELRRHTADHLRWWPVAVTPEQLAEGLLPVLDTPLGPLANGLTLRGVPLTSRLRELDFEFPLAGGDVRGAAPEVLLRDLAPLLRTHLPADDPLAAYAHKLEQPALGDQVLRGYLSGSIDVVLAVPADDGSTERRTFVVADYKTNLLGEPGIPVTASDYRHDRLAEAMLHSHYPLQAMLYSVVLHRYLRWRLPDYEPRLHLGGVLYLYLRGMCGPDTPVTDGHPAGVFSWSPPPELIVALSEVLAG